MKALVCNASPPLTNESNAESTSPCTAALNQNSQQYGKYDARCNANNSYAIHVNSPFPINDQNRFGTTQT